MIIKTENAFSEACEKIADGNIINITMYNEIKMIIKYAYL